MFPSQHIIHFLSLLRIQQIFHNNSFTISNAYIFTNCSPCNYNWFWYLSKFDDLMQLPPAVLFRECVCRQLPTWLALLSQFPTWLVLLSQFLGPAWLVLLSQFPGPAWLALHNQFPTWLALLSQFPSWLELHPELFWSARHRPHPRQPHRRLVAKTAPKKYSKMTIKKWKNIMLHKSPINLS